MHGGVHHDELALWIDVDPLSAHAPEEEHPALAGKDPRLVAVAEGWGRPAWPQMRLIRTHRRRVPDPCRWDDLAAEVLKKDPALKAKLEEKKKADEKFAANGSAQLDFIYKNSPFYEPGHNRYPVYRLLKR